MDAVFVNFVLTAAIGFALGGVLMSGHFLLTGKVLGFALDGGPPALLPLHILLRLIAGPAILVRNVFTMQDDSLSLTVAGVGVAIFWSLGSGALLLQSIGHL